MTYATRCAGRLTLQALLVVALAATLAACSGATKTTAQDLVKGDRVILRLSQSASGLTVSGVDVETDDDGDDHQCEDGIAPDGTYCDGGPDANKDDGSENDGAEDDNVQMVVGKLDMSGQSARVLWLDVALGDAKVDQATYRFTGKLTGATLAVSAVSQTVKETPRVMGSIDAITRRPDGQLAIDILGHSLTVNPRLRIRELSSLDRAISADVDGDTDQDGVVCEQEGEHEGDNVGC